MSIVPMVRAYDAARQTRLARQPFEQLWVFVAALAAWLIREARIRRDTRRLAEFSDHMLRDIGIARSDIEGAVRRGHDDARV